jgi:chromosomal replication initiation ATPase DnaA
MTTPTAQYIMPFAHTPSYAPHDFIVHAGNEAALTALDSFPDWPSPVMGLVGPPASGKTHAVHWLAARHAVRLVHAEELSTRTASEALQLGTLHVIDLTQHKTLPSPKPTGGDGAVHATLAQWINHALATGAHILLVSQAPLASLHVKLPDLHSRFRAVPCVQFAAPDDATMHALLHKACADIGWRLAPEVAHYVATRLPREARAIQHFMQAANVAGLAAGRALTVPLAKAVLEEMTHDARL